MIREPVIFFPVGATDIEDTDDVEDSGCIGCFHLDRAARDAAVFRFLRFRGFLGPGRWEVRAMKFLTENS